VWAVGRLGVAACVAAAVDRQARQSCLVWCGGVNWLLFSFTPQQQQQQQQQWRTRVPRSDWLARVVVVVVFLRAPTASFSSTRECEIFMRLRWRPL